MKLLIHDLPKKDAELLHGSSRYSEILPCSSDNRTCIGCFGCWLKTPGECRLQDDMGQMGMRLSRCEEITIVSRCFWGGFSPQVKRALDRSIPYLHPDFQIKNKEMHHKLRYDNEPHLRTCFYGDDITDDEKQTAMGLVRANCVNLGADLSDIRFFSSAKEVLQWIHC